MRDCLGQVGLWVWRIVPIDLIAVGIILKGAAPAPEFGHWAIAEWKS